MQAISALPEGAYMRTADGHRMHYLDQGKGDCAVVFLHGSGPGASGHSNFKFNYPELLKAGHRVIVIDHVGYGRSDKPTKVDYHLDFFVGAVMEVLDHLSVKSFVPIGNSLGGAIAIKMTLDHPKRVPGLILMAPGGVEEKERYFTMPGMQVMAKFFGSLSEESPPTAKELKKVLEELVHEKHHVNDELVEERLQVFRTQHAGVITTMQVPNMCSRLAEIQCPVLGFWGAA
jgi:4,5:9,10-diseco-3-hydroxy-5,9,17-trioxoandrosta-1(10),2-diene-4-oate hydrolase